MTQADVLKLARLDQRPTMEEVMMDLAVSLARRSTCARLQVGCVITDARFTSIYALGYNGNYRGGPHACDREEPGNCGCLHAEDNALVKLRTEERGLVLFTTVSPCTACAKRIVNQGNVETVWIAETHRDLDASAKILAAGGVMMRRLGSGTGTQAEDAEVRLCLGCRTKYTADLDLHAGGYCPNCGSRRYEPAVASVYEGAGEVARKPEPRYVTRAVLDDQTLETCREWDGTTVAKPMTHGEGCRCTFEQIADG